MKAKEKNGDAEKPAAAEVHIYRALYLKQDLRQLTEGYRNMVAAALVTLMDDRSVRSVKAIQSDEEKEALSHGPAIWFLRDAPYRPGLDGKRQAMVNK